MVIGRGCIPACTRQGAGCIFQHALGRGVSAPGVSAWGMYAQGVSGQGVYPSMHWAGGVFPSAHRDTHTPLWTEFLTDAWCQISSERRVLDLESDGQGFSTRWGSCLVLWIKYSVQHCSKITKSQRSYHLSYEHTEWQRQRQQQRQVSVAASSISSSIKHQQQRHRQWHQCKSMVTLPLTLLMGPRSISKHQEEHHHVHNAFQWDPMEPNLPLPLDARSVNTLTRTL